MHTASETLAYFNKVLAESAVAQWSSAEKFEVVVGLIAACRAMDAQLTETAAKSFMLRPNGASELVELQQWLGTVVKRMRGGLAGV